MMVRVEVMAPEGRFITGFGGQEQGGFFEMDAPTAERLVAADPGLKVVRPKAAAAAKSAEAETENS